MITAVNVVGDDGLASEGSRLLGRAARLAIAARQAYIRPVSITVASMLPPFDEIQANFEFLDEPDDRLDYLIELGRLAPTLPEELKTEANQVRGCLSQVWLVTDVERKDGRTRLIFRGDSDAITTRGIVALIIAIYSGRSPQEVRATDALDIFRRLGLSDHITSKRSNGARAMVERIHRDAESALAA